MMIREAAFAGRFYDDRPDACLASINACLDRGNAMPASDATDDLDRIVGGVVPHAGWIYSGPVTAKVIQELARRPHPQAVVIFGAIHVLHGHIASIFPSGAWETPLGLAGVDERLSDRLLGQTGLLESSPHSHEFEHSIEVEVPFLQHLLPAALVVPIMVPVNDKAVALGRAVGRACRTYGVRAAFLCSTDLTHYGPGFSFTPQGSGPAALQWSKDVSDRRMIDLILEMRSEDAVEESVIHRNACGGGAIGATLAACQAYGATSARLLAHTASHEVSRDLSLASVRDTVGYAGIVFG
ncbi:MAG: AmmeMemoRadiSam system protein B [Phycisphaerae bacterium]|nr:AmmeMemoRadiSam system protein B [Phycisphaerae bacterium]